MPITVQWDNPEKTIIMVTCAGRWTHRDFTAAVQQRRQLMGSVAHHVDIIMDMSGGQFIPMRMFTTLINLSRHIPANRRLLIYIRASGLFRVIVGTVIGIVPRAGRNLFFVESISDAKAIIANYDRRPNGNVA